MNAFIAFLTLCSLFIYFIVQSLLLLLVPKRFRTKKELRGQTVLITGAGSGLGRQLAIELSRLTLRLVLLDINKKSLEETLELIDSSSSAFIYKCDVADRKRVYEVAEDIQRAVGDVDVLINNAGIVHGRYLLELPDEKIVKTVEVNVLAHFWLCKAFLPAMMARNHGHVVCVSSIAGYQGGPKLSDYCASKFAVMGFAESLELELKVKKLDGIKVTVVCPSHIDTGLFDGLQIKFSPPLTAEYVAKEVVYGIQCESETIVLPHYVKYLILLKNIFPRWLSTMFHEMSGNLSAMDNFRGRDSAIQDLTRNGKTTGAPMLDATADSCQMNVFQ